MMVILILHVMSLIALTGRDSGYTFPLRRQEYHFIKHNCQMLHSLLNFARTFNVFMFQVVGQPWPARHPYSHFLSPPHSIPMG